MSTTPNMDLILPTVSETAGPDYATEVNTAFETVDSHDHTTDKGVQVPAAGINIDSDLTFNNFNATDFKSVRFRNQSVALGGATDVGCMYEAGGNLFYNDLTGTQIQLTAGGALNAASIGGIGGDYSTSTASVYYQSIDSTYYFTSNTNTPATVNIGSAIIREPAVSSNGITIKSAASLGASYDLTLPSATPASTRILSMTSSGTVAAGTAGTVVAADLANSSVTTAKIADLNVTAAKINTGAVQTAKLDDGAVTYAKIADSTILGSNIATDVNLSGNPTASNSPIATAIESYGGGARQAIANIYVASGVRVSYNGLSYNSGTGLLSFTSTYTSVPAVIVTSYGQNPAVAVGTTSITTSTASLVDSFGNAPLNFCAIVIGKIA